MNGIVTRVFPTKHLATINPQLGRLKDRDRVPVLQGENSTCGSGVATASILA